MNTGLKPVWAGCNMRLDPFRLPQATSYATRDDFGDVHFTIDHRGVVVRRVLEKSGLPVTVILPAKAFRGVAARAMEDGSSAVGRLRSAGVVEPGRETAALAAVREAADRLYAEAGRGGPKA